MLSVYCGLCGALLGLVALFEECRMTWGTLIFMGFSRREIIGVGALRVRVYLTAWFSGTLWDSY